MFFLHKKELKFINYDVLFEYALGFCDVLTLQVPNHNKEVINEKNHAVDLDLEIGHCEISEDPFEEVYYENANRLVEKIFGKYIIKTFFDTSYMTSIFASERKIYLIQVNEEVVNNLSGFGGLFEWQYPLLPEDLCLFTKGKCWLHSIAHEGLCWIYDDSKELKQLLKKNKIKFNDGPGDDAPTLPLQV